MQVETRLSLAAALGRSLLSWYVDGPPLPLSASFAVTNRCNLRCSYCNTPFLDPTDLSLTDVRTIFDRLQDMGVKRLGLAGGEPLVRKDIGEVIGLAKERDMFVTLNTNLTLFSRRREAVQEVDLFFTSLDGDREFHEKARGAGSFDGVIEAITTLVEEGRPVVAICVVTEQDLDQARGLLDLAEKVGFRVHFQPRCVDAEIVRGTAPADVAQETLRSFWAEVLVQKNAGRPVASSRTYLEALARWSDFNRTAVMDENSRCAAGWGFFYIDPRGRAYPCAYTKGKVPAVDFLGKDWRSILGRPTPCTDCSVGPYLEFNSLFRAPVRTALSMAAYW
jgi:MoaA/NifB/PqqE/SkfB family radical SAM enzyme